MKIKEITFENQLYAFVCSLNDVNKGLEFLSMIQILYSLEHGIMKKTFQQSLITT